MPEPTWGSYGPEVCTVSVERDRKLARQKRHLRLRRKIEGTQERPRLCVTKSLKHVYAQMVDDREGRTLVTASTRERELGDENGQTGNVSAAKAVGEAIGRRAIEQGIKRAVFDRAGWPYHGRVKAVAEGAREAGLEL